MFATTLTALTTLLATIGPVEAAVMFATLAPNLSDADRRRIAIRASIIAFVLLSGAILLGGPLLRQLGVSIPALQTAGGIILMMISLDMIFARPSSAFKLTASEGAEAQGRDDIAVFPLATPLLAGPGSMSAGILLAANSHNDPAALSAVMLALVIVMAGTALLLIVSNSLATALGATAQRVLIRVFGILLAAIAVQSVFSGLAGSGLFGKPFG
jgi:multiple antibiotic resistance protein